MCVYRRKNCIDDLKPLNQTYYSWSRLLLNYYYTIFNVWLGFCMRRIYIFIWVCVYVCSLYIDIFYWPISSSLTQYVLPIQIQNYKLLDALCIAAGYLLLYLLLCNTFTHTHTVHSLHILTSLTHHTFSIFKMAAQQFFDTNLMEV